MSENENREGTKGDTEIGETELKIGGTEIKIEEIKTEESMINKIILMDFMAQWCGPCRIQDPILEELKKKFRNKVEFKKIDVDTDGELAIKYVIHAVPTLIIEKDDKIFKKYVGVTSFKELEKSLTEALK